MLRSATWKRFACCSPIDGSLPPLDGQVCMVLTSLGRHARRSNEVLRRELQLALRQQGHRVHRAATPPALRERGLLLVHLALVHLMSRLQSNLCGVLPCSGRGGAPRPR